MNEEKENKDNKENDKQMNNKELYVNLKVSK